MEELATVIEAIFFMLAGLSDEFAVPVKFLRAAVKLINVSAVPSEHLGGSVVEFSCVIGEFFVRALFAWKSCSHSLAANGLEVGAGKYGPRKAVFNFKLAAF